MWISVLGLWTGVDLLFGAKILFLLNKMLTKAEVFNLDKAIVDKRVRIFLGVLFLVISLLMITLLTKNSHISLINTP
jgi:hypothetical protein